MTFFQKKIVDSVSHFKFYLKKEKTFDANDLLALSLVSTIFNVYSLGKKFYCTYLKIKGH